MNLRWAAPPVVAALALAWGAFNPPAAVPPVAALAGRGRTPQIDRPGASATDAAALLAVGRADAVPPRVGDASPRPPPAPPAPRTIALPPLPPPPPPDPVAELRSRLSAVVQEGGRTRLVLAPGAGPRSLVVGDQILGWRVTGLDRRAAVLKKGGETRTAPLQGYAPPPSPLLLGSRPS